MRDADRRRTLRAIVVSVLLSACDLGANADASASGADSSSVPYRIELTSVGVVQDTVFDHFLPGFTRFLRTQSGDLLVGPILRGGETALTRVRSDLITAERQIRRGFGPGEADGLFEFAIADGDNFVIGAPELGRAQVFTRGGALRFSAPVLSNLDGVGLCGNRVVMTGSARADNEYTAGVFVADSAGTSARLLHSLQTDTTRRVMQPYVRLLSVRRDRLIAGIPNRPEVAVSDSGCNSVKRVALPLAWFVPWSGNVGGPDPRPHMVELQWHNDSVALLHVVRANPDAGVTRGEGATAPPKSRDKTVPMFLSELIAFHVETGRIVAHESGPLTAYSFTNASEVSLYLHGKADATEFLTLRLVKRD